MATQEQKETDIPVGTGFSPNVIDLPKYLDAIIRYSGDAEAIREATSTPPVWKGKPTDSRRRKSHPMEAGAQYGLLTEGDYEVTELAQRLADIEDEDELYEEFARHILVNCGGLRVVEAAQQMRMDGHNITGDSLAEYLSRQGFQVTEHNTAINSLRLWLSKAGLLPEEGSTAEAWLPDLEVKEKLIGLDDETIASIAQLPRKEVEYLKALCRASQGGTKWFDAARIRDMAEGQSGIHYGRQSLPEEVLEPLAETGLIEYKTGGTTSGSPSRVRPTEKFSVEVLQPFLENALEDLDPALKAYYQVRPEEIYDALDADDSRKKGEALEAYTIHLMRLLGLRFLGWRKRAIHGNHGQVDVMMGGVFGALPTTWQVQCFNRPSQDISIDTISREIGLATITNATHILIVANAPVRDSAREFANETMRNSPINIFLLDEDDFQAVRENQEDLARILRAQANFIADLRASNPLWSGKNGGATQEDSREQMDLFSLIGQ